MPLKDLEEELADPESGIEKRHQHEESVFNPQSSGHEDVTHYGQPHMWGRLLHNLSREKRRALIFGSVAIAGIILLVGIFAVVATVKKSFFQNENVAITIEGTQSVKSSVRTVFTVRIVNNNRAQLDDVSFTITY